jgi:hypothetical protein
VFVFAHTPIFPEIYHLDSDTSDKRKFWSILEDHQCVIAFLCGHEHIYHRTIPNESQAGIWHITNSPAGGNPRNMDGSGNDDFSGTGFSFMDIYVDYDASEVTFSRWKSTDPLANGSWNLDDQWTVSFVKCSSVFCSSSSSISSSSSSLISSSSSSLISSSSSSLISSSSSSLISSSSSSLISSSSSSLTSSSSTVGGDHHHDHHHSWVTGFEVLSEEEAKSIIRKYSPKMKGMSYSEKEDFLVEKVIKGEISADEAIVLAVNEGLILDS